MDDVTRVGAYREGGRVRCDLRPGALSPRVLSASPTTVRIALVATRALLLGGDRVRVEVHVGRGVEVELVEVSGTVAYAGRGRSASWDVAVRVDDDGLLVWDALPFVVADGADVDRRTDVRLGRSAVALLRETLVLGRTGERGGRLRSRTRATDETGAPRESPDAGGTPRQARELFVEDLGLGDDRALPGILGDARVVDSVLCLGARPPAAHAAAPSGPLWLDLDGPGAVVRHLGASTHDAGTDGVVTAWAAAARATRGLPDLGLPDHRTALLTT
ncbi:MAG: urease accessory protein UreD, partial [Cellulosimicrobium funkei]